jgi:hypothetical protein
MGQGRKWKGGRGSREEGRCVQILATESGNKRKSGNRSAPEYLILGQKRDGGGTEERGSRAGGGSRDRRRERRRE